MSDRIYNVLFLCTGNTARSILAESILRKDGRRPLPRFFRRQPAEGDGQSLCAQGARKPRLPHGRHALEELGGICRAGAPVMDFVFTVCDNAAGETCPVWPGQPMTAHWGIDDPARGRRHGVEKEAAFAAAFRYLKQSHCAFTSLPLHSIDRLSLGTKLRDIGRIAGSTSGQEKAS